MGCDIHPHAENVKSQEVLVLVTCAYFKASGKYYTEGAAAYPASLFEECIYPRDYGRRLLELKRLPGLQSGTWSGCFTVRVMKDIGSYTELVVQHELVDHIS